MTDMSNRLVDFANSQGDSLGAFALTASIQVAALVGILFLIDWTIRRRARAVFRYAMWLLVLVKLVLPVSFGTPASIGYWVVNERQPMKFATSLPQETRPEPKPAPPSTVSSFAAILPVTESLIPALDTAEPGAPAFNAIAVDAQVDRTSATPVAAESFAPPLHGLRPTGWIFAGWCGIVALLSGLLVQRGLGVRWMVAQATEPPADTARRLAECCALLNVRDRVRLKLTQELRSPAICGIWHPTILLPERLLGTLDAEQMRMVFFHELVHWKRGDLQVQFVQGILQILYFFHPAVWLANAMLRRLREQAVDETVLVVTSNTIRYSETLLDICARSSPVPELTLGLLGVVESRRALAQRIWRIIERPTPKSARVGISGTIALAVIGLALLPMAGGSRAEQQQPVQLAQARAQAQPQANAKSEKSTPGEDSQPKPMLSGRITDDLGAPVTDATLELTSERGDRSITSKTDAEGRYRFEQLIDIDAGEFRLQVNSLRCISIRRFDELPRLNLTAAAAMVRDFVLKRACQVRIRAIDEEGQPIRGVKIYAANVHEDAGRNVGRNAEGVATDQEGWAVIGSLAPSKSEYLFGASHEKYGFGKLVVTLNDPDVVATHEIRMLAGTEIKGTAVCSDGHPPAGWQISAYPTWWTFGVYPKGASIGQDGSFTLPHIVPGAYSVTISVPIGVAVYSPRTVLREANLAEVTGPLAVKLNYPSPASMAPLEIRVRYIGGAPRSNVRVHARSLDGLYTGDGSLEPGDEKVVLGPLPHGLYDVDFYSPDIESTELKGATVPSKDVEIKIQVLRESLLKGRVVSAETNMPVTAFRIRAERKNVLRASNYRPTWHEFKNEQGRFETAVAGPGVYVLHIEAAGLASASSEELNTDSYKDREILFKLNKASSPAASSLSIVGTVVDEANRPIDGAIVRPVVKTMGLGASENPQSLIDDGVAKTEEGKFRLEGLKAGKEKLKVTHPDFAQLFFEVDVDGTMKGAQQVNIVLKRGSTVRGRVYDALGRPEPGVALYVEDRHDFTRNRGRTGRFAAAVTDRNGEYEFTHVPDHECVVARASGSNSLGVFWHSIWPVNDKLLTLDFGGTSKVSGQLVVNGSPLASARLVFSDSSPIFGVMMANGQTEGDGSFVFRGIPQGKRTLYWYPNGQGNAVRVGTFVISPDGNSLGRIDVPLGELSVRFVKPVNLVTENIRLSLVEINPGGLFLYGDVGLVVPPAMSDGSYSIRQVPLGRYEIVAWYSQKMARVQVVDVTPSNLNQTVPIRLEAGSARVTATVDPAKYDLTNSPPLQIRSHDNRLVAIATFQPKGAFEFSDLPSGDYLLTQEGVRDAAALARFTLTNDESKTLDLTEALLRNAAEQRGVVEVYAFTPEGIVLPGCDMKLVRQNETILPQTLLWGRTVLTGPPGTYELTVEFPGFETHRQTIVLAPSNKARSMYSMLTNTAMAMHITMRPLRRP